jgi:type 1 glutamine amidotransferase
VEISILLVSDGLVHPSLPARFCLRRALAGLPGYRFQRAASLEVLPPLPPDSFRAIALYVHHAALSTAAMEGLDDFLRAGGGLLAIHSASASFREEPRYYDILGGQFVHHSPVEEFIVQPAEPPDEVFGVMAPFSVRDELYRHEYDPTNRVHFYATVGEEREPVVWTRHWGQGRVCYCALGHTLSAMRHPHVHQILQHGLAWAAKGEVA